MDGYVTTKVTRRRRIAPLTGSWSRCWLIGWDSWFISHSTWFQGFGTEHVPFSSNVVVSLENKTTLAALHGMFHSEGKGTAVAAVREMERVQAKTKVEVVTELFSR